METKNVVELYSYWRSSSAWRVRNVLQMKGIVYNYKAVNLLEGAQASEQYAHVNPMKAVPSITIDGHTFAESVAIMEYLEETRPNPPLLPKDSYQRALTRQLVEMVVSDMQPIQNMKVLTKIGEEKKAEWAKYWIDKGFEALEQQLKKTSGKYSLGDEVTLADCVLVPQVYNAIRWQVDMSKFPTISRVNEELSKLEAFKAAHPDVQPDAPKK